MEREPNRFVTRLLELCAAFALCAYLLKLGVTFLIEIWWILLLIAAVIGIVVVLCRIYRNRAKW